MVEDSVKAQVSIEFLVIVGFALLMTVPVIMIFFSQSTDISDSINTHQADRVTKKLVNAAEKVFYIGQPSQTLVKIDMPENVDEVVIRSKEIGIRLNVIGGTTDIYKVSLVNVTGNISITPGAKNVLVKADMGYVNISEV